MRCSRWLIRAGFLDGEVGDHAADDTDDTDGALGALQTASIARRIALGLRAGKRVRRYRVLGGEKVNLPAAQSGRTHAELSRVGAEDAFGAQRSPEADPGDPGPGDPGAGARHRRM